MSEGAKREGIYYCTPILYANSVSASIRYYTEVLGFKVGWRWSDETQSFLEPGTEGDVGFALVVRDEVGWMLSQQSQGHPGTWLHLDVKTPDEVDAMYREWSVNGARIVEAPENRSWGNYEMRVADLDGHVLRVASPAKPAA